MSAHLSFESKLLGLSGKAAIVTGAGGGIGGEVIRLFAELGMRVLAVDQRFEQGAQGPAARGMVAFEADVARSSAAEEAVRRCVDEFGGVDVLVNNAGMIRGGSVLDMKEDDWDRIMEVNLGGYRNFARAAATEMVKRKTGGVMVNVSSVDGIMAEPGILAYSASKGAIIMLTKCLAIELAPHRIRVNSVAPGWVDTPMGTGVLDAKSRKIVDKRIPLGYIAPPAEIARSVAFLASDLSRYMTGHIMVVDGGLTSDISIPGLSY
ncbi:MAG: glucose 1-dehydrogenase [Nitrososphaerota archaeon]|nr:glucose 1-dehydrogenase [Nitrososphaerota archaeon]